MTTSIDHISYTATDLAKSRVFYEAALAPLGMRVIRDFGEVIGIGVDMPYFWLAQGGENAGHFHIAFRVDTRAEVDYFYDAAIKAGGKDNGGPGLRPEYHANYYGAFVLDPDGHNIEAVCHAPH
jgi:catechol 2,3-dioxygenase-like lactoylglutathione lyase family enzyme